MSKLGPKSHSIFMLTSLLLLSAQVQAGDIPETFKCSARGGPQWREYRSKHFLLDTDLSNASASVLIKDLERTHALVLQAMLGEQVEIPGRVRVIGFNNPAQFHEFAPYWVGGYFGISHLKEQLIALPVSGQQAYPEVIAHELVHHLSWFMFPRQPRWFSEGLASFIETVATETVENGPELALGSHIVRGDTRLRGGVGIIPRNISWALREIKPVPVKELLSWGGREDSGSPGRHHVQSWLLYHWLWNNRSKEFSEFQKRLSEAEDPFAAWRAAFPEFDPLKPATLESLDDTLRRYRESARYVFYRVKAEGDGTFTESPFPPAEVHLALLEAMVRGSEGKASDAMLRAEVDEALREDPTQPAAISLRAHLEHASPTAALRKSTAARPSDWRAWFFLGQALTDPADQAEGEGAYRKAVALNPDSAAAQNGLARTLALKGSNKEALPFANRAVDLAPWDTSSVNTLAAVVAGLGKCPEALVLQRRAVSLFDAMEGGAGGDAYAKKLREYEERCGRPTSK